MNSTMNRTERTYVWSALSAARVPVPAPAFMAEFQDKHVLTAGGNGSFGFRGLIADTDPTRSSPPPG